MKLKIILFVVAFFISAPCFAETTITIAVDKPVIDDYEKHLKAKSFANRGTTEINIIKKALTLGGVKDVFIKLIPSPSAGRAQLMAKDHDAMMSLSMWRKDYDDSMLISHPFIRNGEFEKGIYVLKENKDKIKITSLKELQEYTSVIVSSWTVDRETLKGIGVKQLLLAPTSTSMLKMLKSGRADFILSSFAGSGENLEQVRLNDIVLTPMPNIKIGLVGTRVLGLSKTYPGILPIYNALQKGLLQLRENGEIRKMYEQDGFFNAKVKDWEIIYPIQ